MILWVVTMKNQPWYKIGIIQKNINFRSRPSGYHRSRIPLTLFWGSPNVYSRRFFMINWYMKWYKATLWSTAQQQNIEKQNLPCLQTNILHKQCQANHTTRTDLPYKWWIRTDTIVPTLKRVPGWQKSVNTLMF